MSTIPFPNKDGEYYGSMTYKRLLSLTKGSFCMPTPTFWKNFKDDDTDERLEKIQKYLNFTDPNECKRNNGTILQLSKENLQDLLKGGPLGKKYWEYVEKINLLYHECLMKFSEVLDILQLNDNITTNNLNEISKRVKYIIDELYTNTQLNYILAVMVLLDYDFEKKRLVKEKKYNQKQKRLAIIEQGGKTV